MIRRQITSIACFLISLAISANANAQSGVQDVNSVDRVGTTAAQFLKIGAGARAIGMAGAYTAVANDILSIYWNPAGLARIAGGGEASFSHAQWLVDTDFDFAAFSVNAGNFGSLGFQVTSFRSPEQPVRTIRSPGGTGQVWDAGSFAFGATYAKSLTDKFSIGFTAKFVTERIFNVSAKGGAFDIGVLYDTPFSGITLGAAISNFGTKMSLDGRDLFFNSDPLPEEGSIDLVPSKYRTDEFDMPLSMRFGLAWNALQTENIKVVASADGVQPNDNSEYVNAGVEVALKNVLFLRGGYKALFLDDSEQGATLGAGLRYDVAGTNIRVDFAWADFGRLDNVKFVSVAIRY